MSWRKYLNNQNWNIGFAVCTPEELIEKRTLPKVSWMKHSYKDRFFADPFILKVTSDTIVLFAEELEFEHPKGRLVELVVDRQTKELRERYLLLELDTHLSYPAIQFIDGEIYVYPENGAAGKLSLYVYCAEQHCLKFKKVISFEALADSTIYQNEDGFWLFATRVPRTQEDLFLYRSKTFDGLYEQVGQVVNGLGHSRSAGNLFMAGDRLYRPAQYCKGRYGAGIEIRRIVCLGADYQEEPVCSLRPASYRYNLGMHTINFSGNVCVIDGYGYLYPFMGRVVHWLWRMKNRMLKKNGR